MGEREVGMGDNCCPDTLISKVCTLNKMKIRSLSTAKLDNRIQFPHSLMRK